MGVGWREVCGALSRASGCRSSRAMAGVPPALAFPGKGAQGARATGLSLGAFSPSMWEDW